MFPLHSSRAFLPHALSLKYGAYTSPVRRLFAHFALFL
jgi:hypothetical protein